MLFSFLQDLNIYHNVITSSKVLSNFITVKETETILFTRLFFSQFREIGKI